MKTYERVDVQTHVFLTSALVAGEWSASRHGRFTAGERAPGTHWIGGWVGPRAGLDDMEKWKFFPSSRLKLRPLGLPARRKPLYRLSYPGSVFKRKFNWSHPVQRMENYGFPRHTLTPILKGSDNGISITGYLNFVHRLIRIKIRTCPPRHTRRWAKSRDPVMLHPELSLDRETTQKNELKQATLEQPGFVMRYYYYYYYCCCCCCLSDPCSFADTLFTKRRMFR
jgi:hypothetical protein